MTFSRNNGRRTVYRVAHAKRFTTVQNESVEALMSEPDALGVWIGLMTKPDDEELTNDNLQAWFDMGRERLQRIMRILEQRGFMRRRILRQPVRKTFAVRELVIFETQQMAAVAHLQPDLFGSYEWEPSRAAVGKADRGEDLFSASSPASNASAEQERQHTAEPEPGIQAPATQVPANPTGSIEKNIVGKGREMERTSSSNNPAVVAALNRNQIFGSTSEELAATPELTAEAVARLEAHLARSKAHNPAGLLITWIRSGDWKAIAAAPVNTARAGEYATDLPTRGNRAISADHRSERARGQFISDLSGRAEYASDLGILRSTAAERERARGQVVEDYSGRSERAPEVGLGRAERPPDDPAPARPDQPPEES
jgi:hypothetical protein